MIRRAVTVAVVSFLLTGCAFHRPVPPCTRTKAAYHAATLFVEAAVTAAPRDWWETCANRYRERHVAWLVMFPLGFIAPIECGGAHTLGTTIIVPAVLLPFGVAFGVLAAPVAAAAPNDWCDPFEMDACVEPAQNSAPRDEAPESPVTGDDE